MSQPPPTHSTRSPGQASSDSRGGNGTKGTTKGPRYLYYRMYTKDGAIHSHNPIYANDPFISRTLAKRITPPHTALSVKGRLCSIEGFPSTTVCTLFESLSSQTAVENATRLSIISQSGPGLSEDDPVIVVVGPQDVEKRSAAKVQPGNLPDAVLRKPRYLYYHLYKELEGAMTSKTSFDADDDTLGRIDMISVAPPHTAASLKCRITKAEGHETHKSQIFKDIGGEELMNDDDHLFLLAEKYPGCEEDNPIAVVCGEVDENQKKGQSFSKSIKVTAVWVPDPPRWLTVSSGEVLKTDGVKTSAIHKNDSRNYPGYMAMNAAGTVGFVAEDQITFC